VDDMLMLLRADLQLINWRRTCLPSSKWRILV